MVPPYLKCWVCRNLLHRAVKSPCCDKRYFHENFHLLIFSNRSCRGVEAVGLDLDGVELLAGVTGHSAVDGLLDVLAGEPGAVGAPAAAIKILRLIEEIKDLYLPCLAKIDMIFGCLNSLLVSGCLFTSLVTLTASSRNVSIYVAGKFLSFHSLSLV